MQKKTEELENSASMRTAAYMVGVRKVAEACLYRGWV